MNKYNAVLVYTGYGENSVQSVETIEAPDIEVAMNLLLEQDKRVNEECFDKFEEFKQYIEDFFGHGKVVNGAGFSECGEENCWIVLPEDHRLYETVLNFENWSEEEWDNWIQFIDEEYLVH